MSVKPNQDQSFLKMFQILEENPETTQRTLADHLGIALGMTNTLLRRAVKKGWLKIRKQDKGKLSYQLTQKGLIEKGQMMLEQIQSTLNFYNEARDLARKKLQQLKKEGIKRIAIRGNSNVSEIIYLTAKEVQIEVVCVINENGPERWLDIPNTSLKEIEKFDPEILVLDFLKKEEFASWDQSTFPCCSLVEV